MASIIFLRFGQQIKTQNRNLVIFFYCFKKIENLQNQFIFEIEIDFFFSFWRNIAIKKNAASPTNRGLNYRYQWFQDLIRSASRNRLLESASRSRTTTPRTNQLRARARGKQRERQRERLCVCFLLLAMVIRIIDFDVQNDS